MIWRSLRNAEASIHISEKKRVGGNLAEGSRAGASYRGVMPGGHFYREALFSFFTSFIASTQVESMTAASPFMKFIELIGQLCSVTRSCEIIVTSCTRHAFYQFIFERFKVHNFLSSFLYLMQFQLTMNIWKSNCWTYFLGQLSTCFVFDFEGIDSCKDI